MNVTQLISPTSVLANVHARSKKHCLEIVSELLSRAQPGFAGEEIFVRLVERERLGSTSLHNGVAFPHCRLSGIETSTGALVSLSEPIDFDSPDGEMVDIVVGLIIPEQKDPDRRADIAAIAGRLGDAELRTRLRNVSNNGELHQEWLTLAREYDEGQSLHRARNA